MATTPVTPVPKTTTTTPAPTQGWAWLKAHEILVALVLLLAVGVWGYGRFLDASSSKAEARANTAEQALVAQKAQDAQNAAQILTLTQQYQQLTATLATQNASLAASLASRQTAQAAQQATDAHLAPSALATRLQQLANTLPEEVALAPDGKIDLTQSGAVKVTQTLEQIAPLQADLKDTQATLGATQAAKAQADTLIAAQGTQITGLNLAMTDQDKACKTEIASVKADAKKSKWSWFKRGFVVGAVTGFVGGVFSGHAGF